MRAQAVTLVAPSRVELRALELTPPGPTEALVKVEASGLSAGTERLVYLGRLEPDQPLDTSIPGLEGGLRYPLRYGYCAVGTVEAVGAPEHGAWVGRRVFTFAPHQSHVVVPVTGLHALPTGVSAEAATMLANVETAVSLVMDGAPLLGEVSGVVGLGVVGQLVAELLARVGLGQVIAVDPRDDRRELAPAGVERWVSPRRDACDVVFEVSGKHAGLASALELARADGRIIAGSWYGPAAEPLALGTRIHRARQTIRFSQVSRLDPALAGRFDHARRLAVASEWLGKLALERLVTHRLPAARAAEAFEMLVAQPPGCLQIVLRWT
jgi:2-desacetyl-2-hydroxyethyl bacteriochlorophyllide A dehydrogenase